MKIEKLNVFTGERNTLDLNVTEEQLKAWRSTGRGVQDVMPHLTDDERDFLISGLLPGQLDELFPQGGESVDEQDIGFWHWFYHHDFGPATKPWLVRLAHRLNGIRNGNGSGGDRSAIITTAMPTPVQRGPLD